MAKVKEKSPFVTTRLDRDQAVKLKRVLHKDPEFADVKPRWTLTDLLRRAVDEFLERRGNADG